MIFDRLVMIDRDDGAVQNEENVGGQIMSRVRLFRSGAELRSDQATLQECGIRFGVIQGVVSRIQPSYCQVVVYIYFIL